MGWVNRNALWGQREICIVQTPLLRTRYCEPFCKPRFHCLEDLVRACVRHHSPCHPNLIYLMFYLGWFFFIFYLKICFDVDHFLKVFIEFVTILLQFYVLVFWPRGMRDPSSPTRDRTRTPYNGRWSPNHWTTREVPLLLFNFILLLFF